jgi:hypothetical protein
MRDLNDYFFGPLSKNWCLYFYFLSILWFVTFVVSIFYLGSYLAGKNVNRRVAFGLLMYSLTVLVMYFEKRILHGMCIKSSSAPTAGAVAGVAPAHVVAK